MFWITHHSIKEDRNRKTGLGPLHALLNDAAVPQSEHVALHLRENGIEAAQVVIPPRDASVRPNQGDRQHRQLFAPLRGAPLILENATSLPEEFVRELPTFPAPPFVTNSPKQTAGILQEGWVPIRQFANPVALRPVQRPGRGHFVEKRIGFFFRKRLHGKKEI
jgi:hypothetical protein